MKLALFTSPWDIEEEHHLLAQFFEQGLEDLYLRKPTYTPAATHHFVEHTSNSHRKQLYLMHDYETANAFEIKGIHLSPDEPVYVESKTELKFSQTAHSFEELNLLPDIVERVFVSPIFNSISKKEYPSKFTDKDALWTALAKFKIINPTVEVYALGGIDVDTIQQVAEIGFHGVGVLGAVWGNTPQERTLNDHWEKFNEIQSICSSF